MADSKRLIFAQRSRNILGSTDEPGGAGSTAAEFTRCRVEVIIHHIAVPGQVEKTLLANGNAMATILPTASRSLCYLCNLCFGLCPGLLRGVTKEGCDPQSEFEWRQVAVRGFAQRLQAVDTFGHVLTP